MVRLHLPDVTLCAAASVNVRATVSALHRCLDQVDFASCLLFTNVHVPAEDLGPRVTAVSIPKLSSAEAYSHFLLRDLASHIQTSHCLVVQWDGFVLDASRWEPEFLDYDYIGAPWPQFGDDRNVGNGGFSLRSKKLLEACKDADFHPSHPEDVAIARTNRDMLERKYAVRFADPSLAARFSFERSAERHPTFGFHGIFNLIAAIGPDEFWKTYRSLDDRSTIAADYWRLMRQVGQGRRAWSRRAWLRRAGLTLDRLRL